MPVTRKQKSALVMKTLKKLVAIRLGFQPSTMRAMAPNAPIAAIKLQMPYTAQDTLRRLRKVHAIHTQPITAMRANANAE